MIESPRDSPYQGLKPYDENDAPYFFGRDRDTRLIIASLFAAPLTLLYGASGVGKTSVLRAGVASQLRQRDNLLVVVFNAWQSDPVDRLKAAVAEAAGHAAGEHTLPPNSASLTEYLTTYAARLDRRLMVILDQFEEYFLYHPREDTFAAEFPRAVVQADLSVSFLIAIREDALAKIDRFEGHIPMLFDNYLRLEYLNRDAAREAIDEPRKVYNQELPPDQHIGIEDGLVDEVIEQVESDKVLIGKAGGGRIDPREAEKPNEGDIHVETPYLQLVLVRLWDEEMKQSSRVLRLATLTALGGAVEIMRKYLDSELGKLNPSQQWIAANVFFYLVTPSGTKIAHTITDLARYTNISEAQIQTVVDGLVSHRILRPIDSGIPETATRYEIFHDAVAPAVLDWRARYFNRSTFSKRLIAIGASVLICTAAIEFIIPLPPLILALARGVSLIVTNILALMQIYKWFARYIGLTIASFSVAVYSDLNLGILLAVLLTMLWYTQTEWPQDANSANPLGTMIFSDYLQFYLAAVILTLFCGFITFLGMLGMGQVTYRLFKNFDRGFYGVYFGVCVLIASLIILTLLGVLSKVIHY